MTGPTSAFDSQKPGYVAVLTEKIIEYLGSLKSAPKVESPDDVVIDEQQTSGDTIFVQFTVNNAGGRPYTDVTHFTL